MPTVRVFPEESLVDEEINLVVEGLKPQQDITVYAALKGDGNDVFDSYAHYKANDAGKVDFFVAGSTGGSYHGLEPMGLFWGMIPSPNNVRPHSRLVVRDVELPVEVEISIFNSHLRYEQIEGSRCLNKRFVRRWYKDRKVKRVPVRHGRLRGTLFIPDGKGPFPAVIDLFGSAGGLMEFRSALLASRGFLALALAFFAYEDLPDTAFDVDLAYFEEAKVFLQQQPEAPILSVGIIGVSVGGTLALATATHVSGFACAISINGPVFAQYASMEYKGHIWRAIPLNLNRANIEDGALVLSHILDDYWNENLGESDIELEKCTTPLLFIYSEDDKAINAMRTVSQVKNTMQKSKCSYRIITYAGAGHLLEPPYGPHAAVTHTKLMNLPQRWGGNPKQHSNAQVQAWREMMQFLRRYLIAKPAL